MSRSETGRRDREGGAWGGVEACAEWAQVAVYSRYGARREDTEDALRELGVLTGREVLDRTCEWCGDRSHGRPRAVDRYSGELRLNLSVSYSGRSVGCAWSATTKLGLDLVEIGTISPRDFCAVAASPAERTAVGEHDCRAAWTRCAVLWAGKEAVLKACGVGLTVDPTQVCCEPLNTVQGKPCGVAVMTCEETVQVEVVASHLVGTLLVAAMARVVDAPCPT